MRIKVTEPNGKSWYDDQWVEAPDQEDVSREYNHGALVEIEDENGEIESYEA